MKKVLKLLFLAICILAIAGAVALIIVHINEMSFRLMLCPIIGLGSLIWTCCSLFKQLKMEYECL